MATSGLVGPFMTSYDREGNRPVVGGLFRRILDRLSAHAGVILPEETDAPSVHTSFISRYHRHVTPFDAFRLQVVLDEMTADAGVQVMLYTRFVDCICREQHITTVVLAALEGLRCVTADRFIDCTGNADVAAAAGVPTWKGEEESGVPQPATLMFEVDRVDDAAYTARPQKPVKAYRMPDTGRYKVNHFRVFNTDAADSMSMSHAHAEARRQVLEAYRILHDETPGFAEARLTQVAPVLGVRESRHIAGRYKITVEDIADGTKFDDRIAAYAFGMDVHPRSPEMHGNFKIKSAEVYYIPYRSLLPLGCSNLIVAGKTISCASQAAGGLRVMPCAMAMGEAAGIAAALSCCANLLPDALPYEQLQAILRDRGAILD